MDTRIPSTPNLSASASAPRVTPTQPKVPFAEVMGQTAVLGAEAAMRALPGGPLMAAALRGTAGAAGAGATPMQTMSQPLGQNPVMNASAAALPSSMTARAPVAASSAAASSAAEGPGAVAPAGGNAMNIDGALASSQEMNLYYLRIQEQVNAENRSFTTMSNVMKAEHETVKTAIGNIR